MKIVADIKAAVLDITEDRDIENFLGVKIDKVEIETYHLSKTQLINQIVSDMGLLKSDKTPRNTPYLTTIILGKFQNAKKFGQHSHYCSVIG